MPSEPTSQPFRQRPLSPHLQIYKPQLTSGLSIFHRITGVVLCFGMLIFVAWLAAAASGPESYASFTKYAHSIVGQIILFVLSLAFYFHLCTGIRHLLWDSGKFLEIDQVYKTGYIAVAVALILTAVTWLKVL